MRKYFHFLTMGMLILTSSGCANLSNNEGEGAATGGILGAIAGGVIGHQTHDTGAGMLIGGAVGALSGAAIGSQIPKENPYQYNTYPQTVQPVTNVVPDNGSFSVNVPNSNGTSTTVIINRSGNGFVGPQGQFYTQFPSMSQLKAMYGT